LKENWYRFYIICSWIGIIYFQVANFGSFQIKYCCWTNRYYLHQKLLTEKEISITVINKEKFGIEEGKYLIFTPDEVFENSDKFYHGKTNADLNYKKLETVVTIRVKVGGF